MNGILPVVIMMFGLQGTLWAEGYREAEATHTVPSASAIEALLAQVQQYRLAGQFTEALTLLEATQQRNDLTEIDKTQLRIGLADLHRAWGDDLKKHYAYEDAIAHYETAFLLDELDRRKEAAATLVAIGEAYSQLSHYDTARSYYEWARSLQHEIGDRAGASVNLSRIGKSYMEVDQYDKAVEILKQAVRDLHGKQNNWEESKALGSLGSAYFGLGQYDRAWTQYQNALLIARSSHNREEEVHALVGISALLRLRGELAQSLTHLNEALTISRENKDREGEANVLTQFGHASGITDPPKAIGYFEQALAIMREVRSRDSESALLDSLGQSYLRLGQNDKALEYLTQARTINQELHSRRQEGIVLSSLGHVYLARSEYDAAIAAFEQALAIIREIKDRASEGAVLNSLGIVYSNLGRYDTAIAYHEQALAIAREAKKRISEAQTLHNLAAVYYHRGQFEKAIKLFEQVVTIHRETGNRRNEAGTLSGLGLAYMNLGRSQQAVPYLLQALTIARDVQDRHLEGTVLNNLATVHSSLSEYLKAIELEQQALVIMRDLKELHEEAQALGNLGAVYYTLGQYDQARQQYEQALTMFRQVRARNEEGTALASLCAIYNTLDQHDTAREYCEQAVAIAREVGNRAAEALALNNLGMEYATLGEKEKAMASHEEGLTIAKEIQSRRLEGLLLHNLGGQYFDLGQYERAATYEEEALAVQREVQDRDGEAKTLSNLMDTWRARSVPLLAIFYGKQAVNTYQAIRGSIRRLTTELQADFLKSHADTYRELADILLTEGRLAEAEQVLRFLKEEELYEFVRRDAKATDALARLALTKTEEEWARRYLKIADRLTALGQEFTALQAKQSTDTQLSAAEEQRLQAVDNELQVARQAMAAFLKELATTLENSQAAGKRLADLETTTRLEETLRKLGAGTVAVYTVIGKEKSWVMLIAPAVQKAYEVPIAATELNRKVLEFRQALQTPTRDPRPLGRELYDLFVQPLAADLHELRVQTVMWSLDGVLRYVPMAALYDGQHYLVERYRLAMFTLAGQTELTTAPQARWRAAGLGVSKEQAGYAALPEVPGELRGIIREGTTSDGILPGIVKLDADFTTQALQQALLRQYPVVHLASHFHFQPGNETDSYLLLGDGVKLSIADLKGFRFSGVDLLTLSACATAMGGEADGKEVESFAALAQRTGARAVIASLWPVADASTKALMETFYRTRESKKNMSKAEALRQAQLALLQGKITQSDIDRQRGVVRVTQESPTTDKQNPTAPQFVKDPAAPFAHPYYWAPFILIGNWR